MSVPTRAEPHRLDRSLRITAGVLGVIVAVPSFLAFLFVVLFVWLGSDDTPIWLALPLGLLAIVQLYLAIRTLNARLATPVTTGVLGLLELAVGVFLLVGSPTLLPATVAAIVVVFIAGVVTLAAAVRIHLVGSGAGTPAQTAPVQVGRKSSTSSAAAQPPSGGVRAGPSAKPSGSPKTGTANKTSTKKPGRKR